MSGTLRTASLLLSLASLMGAESSGDGLIDAVQRRDRTAIKDWIARGADVNKAGADGSTALHYAAHLNDVDSIRLLLRAGAKTAVFNEYGSSPMLEAAATGNATLLELLLKAGADAKTASAEGETALMLAARAGNPAAVQLLIDHGAAVDAREKWKRQTALMWAAAANRAEAASLLIARGADVNARSASVTPEVKRPPNGNLVSEQPKGNLTPLLFAGREGATETTRVLVKAGADLNAADPDGVTPLIIAIINGHFDAAAVLLEAGANPNLADKWGRTPVYAAVDMNTLEPSTTRPSPKELNKRTGLDVARIALARGAEPDSRLKTATPGRGIPDGPDPLLGAGSTPFLRAAKTGDVAAMHLLIEHRADPKVTTARGVTALMAAAGQGWRYGDSQIPESDALQGVMYCVELGLDVNAVNEKKETALHGAADRGADTIVQYLVEQGASLDAKDARGYTPLDVATGGEVRGHPGNPATAALLKKLIAKN